MITGCRTCQADFSTGFFVGLIQCSAGCNFAARSRNNIRQQAWPFVSKTSCLSHESLRTVWSLATDNQSVHNVHFNSSIRPEALNPGQPPDDE